MRVVLLTNDLMVASRVQGAAERTAATVCVAAGVSQAVDLQGIEPVDSVIVDLATPSVDLQALVREMISGTEKSPRIVAFGPHVHESRLAAARAAGCEVVMSRGQFFAQVDAILGG